MKERPIHFSAPMIRAILDGRKTQARRIVKQKHLPFLENILGNFLDGKWNQRPLPYGKTGDRLWVRETFKQHGMAISYKADGTWITDFQHASSINPHENITWKPSIHMPRSASRILLEITGVRVERLQDISEEDAIAEGVTPQMLFNFGYSAEDHIETFNAVQSRKTYRLLWESINGTGSWDFNPLVWVVEFMRIN